MCVGVGVCVYVSVFSVWMYVCTLCAYAYMYARVLYIVQLLPDRRK